MMDRADLMDTEPDLYSQGEEQDDGAGSAHDLSSAEEEDEEELMHVPLNTQHAENLVWLAKVPMFLLEKWQQSKPNATLGQMHEHRRFLFLYSSKKKQGTLK